MSIFMYVFDKMSMWILILSWEVSESDYPNVYTEQRTKLYEKMARDLDEHGAAFLKHGETSQSLSLSDIFTLKDGSVTPVLKVKHKKLTWYCWILWAVIDGQSSVCSPQILLYELMCCIWALTFQCLLRKHYCFLLLDFLLMIMYICLWYYLAVITFELVYGFEIIIFFYQSFKKLLFPWYD